MQMYTVQATRENVCRLKSEELDGDVKGICTNHWLALPVLPNCYAKGLLTKDRLLLLLFIALLLFVLTGILLNSIEPLKQSIVHFKT